MADASSNQRPAMLSGKRAAFAVVAIYVVFAAVWIAVGDLLLLQLTTDLETYRNWQSYKGWLFVIATSGLLWWLLYQFIELTKDWETAIERHWERLRHVFDSVATPVAITDAEGYFTYVNPAYCEMFLYSSDELLGKHASGVGLSGELPERSPEGTLAYVRQTKSAWRGDALRVDKHGRVIPVLLSVSPLITNRKLYGFLAELIDLRTVASGPLALSGLAATLHKLAITDGFDEVGRLAVADAVALSGGDAGLAVFGIEETLVETRWPIGIPEDAVPPRFRLGSGLIATTIARGKSQFVEEASATSATLPSALAEHFQSVLCVPIASDDEPIGALIVASSQRAYAFAEPHARMLEAIAAQIRVARRREGFRWAHPLPPRNSDESSRYA